MIRNYIIIYFLGAMARFFLMNSSLISAVKNRVEVSTPLNSWLRVKEGVFLHGQGIPVYNGGVYHGTPLELAISELLIRSWSNYLHIIFIALDLITTTFLVLAASTYTIKLLTVQKQERKLYSTDADAILLKEADLRRGVFLVAAAFLFSPYSIVSCAALTTTTFTNLLLAATIYAMLKGYAFWFGASLALVTYQSFYPICLLVPGILEMGHSKKSVVKIFTSFLVTVYLLFFVSSEISGGWQFLTATYGFILSAPDLTPNIGLFWYFFTEMFEHFRLFFLATFQINAFVYVLPLATKLRKDPMLLSLALLALTAVFRSYPSLGDVGFYMSLLPVWKHLYLYLKQTFLVGCMLVSTSVLGPIMYNLWIFNGSANANFYFAVTLAFNTAQIFLVTDLLFAHVKRQYHLFNGSKLEVDGQPATLALE
ncbi:Phosphatidylinositol glycan anchor biosynthesis class U protein [Armadillidium nasatum]|uniref:Phosphatidylinositol glycan anchor biosynthesis class U protein n=1 Tax=Armadillidium nasatum TaxID=96803 RepID=A0A5N5T089_9CRUS|nr:Phosphatidylinositol glycan anchor biosynthesis class U protein [Armadillidium nasatum]